MTDFQLRVLKYLAEKVMRYPLVASPRDPVPPKPHIMLWLSQSEKGLYLNEWEIPVRRFWNPFEDANDALRLLDKVPNGNTVTLDRRLVQNEDESIVAEWAVYLEMDGTAEYAEGYDVALPVAITLACYRATGGTDAD